MLHDILQQYDLWPDLWMYEPWNKYDIGILPSEQWADNWIEASKWYYSRPRIGTFLAGWPKADIVSKINTKEYRLELFKKYGLDPDKRTVLYAPAWENDGKQDDFVKAMLTQDVNILIKQWDADPVKYADIARNIREMYELHKDIERVVILPAQTNICNAIAVSDILVSEESSTMAEAAMLGKPAISVSDWLIPDVTPSRLPVCNFDFVSFTKKADLASSVKEILLHYTKFQKEVEEYKKRSFANIGNASIIIMDILDDVINGRSLRHKSLVPATREFLSPARFYKHKRNDFYRQLNGDIKDNYPILYNLIIDIKQLKRCIYSKKIHGKRIKD